MKLSVVTTLYFSAPYIKEFYARIIPVIKNKYSSYEIIFVNDGSPDNSLNLCLEILPNDHNIKVVDLSRNFGHHKAILAGLSLADGDHVFLIDIDLEEPPECLDDLLQKLNDEKDLDVAYGVQPARKGKIFERLSGQLFYNLITYLTDIDYPINALAARLMTYRYVKEVLKYKEKEIDLWGIFSLVGYNQGKVIIKKSNKGSSVYTFRKKLSLAVNTITSLSNKPLLIISFIGAVILMLSSSYILFLIVQKLFFREITEGWTSTLVSIWFIGGLNLFATGIIGIYLSKIFLETKNRPLTVIREIYQNSENNAETPD